MIWRGMIVTRAHRYNILRHFLFTSKT
jgi:hypothetical protein